MKFPNATSPRQEKDPERVFFLVSGQNLRPPPDKIRDPSPMQLHTLLFLSGGVRKFFRHVWDPPL